LTQHEDAGLAHAVREDGGYAYVVKRLLATDLVRAIDTVLEGKSFISEFAP
jgi:DNA-binding NarL/FixJ family response regulator